MIAIVLLFVLIVLVLVIQNQSPVIPKGLKCYVISLESDHQNRLSWFKKNYEASDARHVLPLEVIPAVDGRALGDEVLEKTLSRRAWQEIRDAETTGFRKGHYQLTRGAVGCYLSHLKVLERIAASRDPGGIVFEDDSKVPRNFCKKFTTSVYDLREKAMDMLLFGCVCMKCNPGRTRKVSRFFQTHGYYVTREGAQKILNILSGAQIEQQIDSALSDLCETGDLEVFCAKPSFVHQGTFKTTIQLPVPKKYSATIRRPTGP